MLRFRDIRVIGPDGSQIGILQSRQALTMAREEGLDLVMVSPNSQPPVCRIVDYGKHKYETEKKEKENKKKAQEVKGIKISPRIAEHDLSHLVNNAHRFLLEGHKVKVTCQFRAREVTHPEVGRGKLDSFADRLKDISVVERVPSMEGRLMIMVLNPKPQTKPQQPKKEKEKNVKAENMQDGGQAIQDNGIGEDHETQGVQQPPVQP